MNIALWIAQGLLAAAFLAAGAMKLRTPYEKIKENMGWAEDFSPGTVKAIGGLELLGALGLILPGIFDIATVLTPLAAVGLIITMVLAAVVHVRRGDGAQMVMTNVILAALAIFVAWGRFGPHSL